MQEIFVTKEEFDEKYEHICRGIDELKEKYYTLDKKIEVIDIKTDALRTEMNERFNSTNEKLNALRTEMNEKFNSLEKRFMMMWTLMVIILLAIIGLYLRGMF